MEIEKISTHTVGTREWAIDVARAFTREAASVNPYRLRGGKKAMATLAEARKAASGEGYITGYGASIWCIRVFTDPCYFSRRDTTIHQVVLWQSEDGE